MGLRDSYKNAVLPAAANPAVSAPAVTVPEPAPTLVTARRDLVALRQRLSGGNGGVNPPEAVAAITEALLDPTTRETPDGGAEPLNPEGSTSGPAGVAAGAAEAVAPSGAAKRKRRTKAEMAAARATEAVSVTPEVSADVTPLTSSDVDANPPGWNEELVAAAAETAGHAILTEELRQKLWNEAIDGFLKGLDLGCAVELVRQRLPRGVKGLEVEA